MYAVSRVRRDVKVVTNRMLTHLEPLSSLFIPVDNMGGKTAKTSLVQMEQHLQNAGVLIFFPAGEVSARRAKVFAIKNGTLALSSWPANCACRCCRCIFRRITACSFTPARWFRRRSPCCC
jgi:putative hemolysin